MAKAKELPPDLPGAPAGDDKPPPKFGTAKPAAEAADLPRVVDPLELGDHRDVELFAGHDALSPAGG